jgi:hypothetical protein
VIVMTLDSDIDHWLHTPLVAGILGSMVGLRWVPGLSWLERLGNVVAGSATAVYAAPVAAEWMQVSSAGMLAGLAFGVGIFGLSLAAAVLQGVRELHVADIVTSWLGRKG